MEDERRLLLLLRHAEAEPTRPGHRDRDRRLTERGHSQAAAVGHAIRSHGWSVDHVLCSAAVRAQESLQDLALGSDPDVEILESLYDAGSDCIIESIRLLPDGVRTALVVGHAPAVPGVLHELVDPSTAEASVWSKIESRFPPATLAAMAVSGRWDRLEVTSLIAVE